VNESHETKKPSSAGRLTRANQRVWYDLTLFFCDYRPTASGTVLNSPSPARWTQLHHFAACINVHSITLLLPPMIFGKEHYMSDEIDDLRTYLAEEGAELTPEQVLMLRDFIDEVGSLEDAILALEQLDEAA
jgi:hypothetical protein